MLEDENAEDAVQSTYVYGEFNLGGGIKRQILGFPYVEKRVISEEGDNEPAEEIEKFQVNLKVCLLPGLIDIPRLKDAFTSSTLVLEVHREDVFKRAFHTRNIEEYRELVGPEVAKEPEPAAAAGKKAPPAKAAPPPKKGVAAPVVEAGPAKTVVTEMTPGDRFLLGCIQRALAASRQIRPHGTARYRLEQLLSSSNDLLTRFARKRQGGAPLAGDETVVVKVINDSCVEILCSVISDSYKFHFTCTYHRRISCWK